MNLEIDEESQRAYFPKLNTVVAFDTDLIYKLTCMDYKTKEVPKIARLESDILNHITINMCRM